jgi:hypothetical protein
MTRIKFTTCPWCGKKHDRVSGVVEKGSITPETKEPVPEDGDATMCIGCGMLSIFEGTAKGNLRFPSKQEWVELEGEKLMVSLLTAFSVVEQNNRETMRTIWHRPDWMT